MKLIIEERTIALPFDRMSEDEFLDFCLANPEQVMERDKNGNILIMAPTNFESGKFESTANRILGNWNESGSNGLVFSSSTGFTLPNRAVRSPDASWISRARVDALPKSERSKFAHICPDFVIEIRSKTDSLKGLQAKMNEYIENGAQLGFLIDPIKQQAYIYRKDGSVETVKDFTATLSGEAVLPGFELPLQLFTTK